MNLKGERVHTILPMSPIIKSKQILGLVLSSFVLFPHGGGASLFGLKLGFFFSLYFSKLFSQQSASSEWFVHTSFSDT